MNKDISFVFFGTGPLAESVLAELVRNGYVPKVVVTKPDAPQGRHMELKPPHIKTWAEMKGIKTLQPEKLDEEFSSQLSVFSCQLFIVASYGKIIPESILNIPPHGVLNVHPSLLPKYRGASPIESALLNGDKETGVTIIKLDKEMDHGPILVQTAFEIDKEATAGTLEVTSGKLGGELLVQTIEHFISGNLIPKEQDHSNATFCKKITKQDGEINLNNNVEEIVTKYKALNPWPGIYFFYDHAGRKIRIKVTKVNLNIDVTRDTKIEDIILSVIPEGKHEISFEEFKRGYMR